MAGGPQVDWVNHLRKCVAAATTAGCLGPPWMPMSGPHMVSNSAGIQRGLPKAVLKAQFQLLVASAVPTHVLAG